MTNNQMISVAPMFGLAASASARNAINATPVTPYVSKPSAVGPTESPALSPVQSAITPGFFGSSSGSLKTIFIGSDLMKIVFKLPEDDPKNPGVIVDCTGDNAGDSVGPTADGFETYGVTGVALIAFLALALAASANICATLIIWLFVMRSLMIVTSLASYFLNEAISKAKFGGKKDFDFEAPLTHLVWITSAVSIGITFAASKLLLGDFSVPKEVLLEGAKRI